MVFGVCLLSVAKLLAICGNWVAMLLAICGSWNVIVDKGSQVDSRWNAYVNMGIDKLAIFVVVGLS